MKYIVLSLLGVLFLSVCSNAQNLNDVENEARAANGKERAEKLIAASEISMTQNDFDRAFRLSVEAADWAKKINENYLRAKALNRIGKSLLRESRKKGLLGREKPARYFHQSNEILQKLNVAQDPLYMDNLEQMRTLALNSGNKNELEHIERQITLLKSGAVPGNGSRQDLQQEIQVLNQELTKQKQAKDTTKAFAARLLEQSQTLQTQLLDRENRLNQMSEGQMKIEYLLLHQQLLLDSLLYRSRVDSLMLANQNLALKESQASRNFLYALAAVLLLFFGGTLYSYLRAKHNSKVLEEKNRIINYEQERSERLLLNILPATVAAELKQRGSTSARYMEDVSVLFADFVNFTKIAERLTPQQLVTDLDTCFRAFDDIIVAHELEKIKTIGDAYLCAGGLMNPHSNQIIPMIHAAREMQQWLAQWNTTRAAQNLPIYEARIGIHRGSVVAGVVGVKKFAFDIWGDTVNTAARIEQASEAGKINLSEAAYNAVRHEVMCQHRGKIAIKNKGEVDMFYVV
jgi:adenylate cyclase